MTRSITRTPDRAVRAMVRAAARAQLPVQSIACAAWRAGIPRARVPADEVPFAAAGADLWKHVGPAWLRVVQASVGPVAPHWALAIVEPARFGAFQPLHADVLLELDGAHRGRAWTIVGPAPGHAKTPPHFAHYFITLRTSAQEHRKP